MVVLLQACRKTKLERCSMRRNYISSTETTSISRNGYDNDNYDT